MSLTKKLDALYQKAIHEATPIEEARTSALLLLKLAKENGVKIRFEEESGPHHSVTADIFANAVARAEEMRQQRIWVGVTSKGNVRIRTETAETPLGKAWAERMQRELDERMKRAATQDPEPERSPVLLHTKFRGVCGDCCTPYGPGDRVWWKRGYTRVHEGCDPHQMRKESKKDDGSAA